MGLAEELVEAMEKMVAAISAILAEFEGSNGLVEEMKSYEIKKNVAKTTGTIIGIAGVCLIPFTFGWSMAATAAGASVNLITEFVDSKESQAFRKRIAKYMDAYKEHCQTNDRLLENLVKKLKNLSEADSTQDLDAQTALLYYCLSTQPYELDGKLVKRSDATIFNKSAQMTGLTLTIQQVGSSVLKSTLKGVSKATIVVGGAVSIYETVSTFMDWSTTHPTIAAAENVVDEMKKSKKSLTSMISKIQQLQKDHQEQNKNNSRAPGHSSSKTPADSRRSKWRRRSIIVSDDEDSSEDFGAGGAGDGEKPNKKDDEKKKKETEITVDSDEILSNGFRVLTISSAVRPENLGQGSNTNNHTARKWLQSLGLPKDYHAGHIIASMLGGSGSNLANLIPMHSGLNNGRFKSFEYNVRDLIENCQSANPGSSVEAKIKVMVLFAKGSKVPCKIVYSVRLSVDGETENVGYVAIFEIKCCSNGQHEGPCTDLHEEYYTTNG